MRGTAAAGGTDGAAAVRLTFTTNDVSVLAIKAPSGITSTMDPKNHHLHKSVFIGEVKADGQFNIVWQTKGPIPSEGKE